MEQDVVFVVELEAAAVHVRRADQGDLAVQRERFRVQQAALVLVDLDPRREQVGVVAAAGRADDPRVVPRGKDDRCVHASIGGRAQRILQCIVGHVIRRSDDDLAPRGEQQGFEHLRHGRVTHRRARADTWAVAPPAVGKGSGLLRISSRFSSTYVIQSLANRNWFCRAMGPSKRITASTQGAYFAFTRNSGSAQFWLPQ